ncbi:MAG: SDR family NAD(P)-dependent oxidoreductase [Bacteroidota bacterium]
MAQNESSNSLVALVTGASSGVGEALAPLLAQNGYAVYGMSRRTVDLPGVTALPADVSDPEALRVAVNQIIHERGHLDAVFHCAGIGGAGPVEQMPYERARRIMDTNFWGSFHICQATLPHLLAAPYGRLLIVGSIGGYIGIPFRSIYCASKGALLNLVESLRLETRGSNLQVACICPGDIATNSVATQYRMPYEEVNPRYRPSYQAADEHMAQNVDHGMTALSVAEQMFRIAQKPTLKPQYILGEPIQKISPLAKRLLPGRLWERVLGSYYK